MHGVEWLGTADGPLMTQAEQVKRATENCGYEKTQEGRRRCFVDTESNIAATLPWCSATPDLCKSAAADIFGVVWDVGYYLFGTGAEEEAQLHAEQAAAWDAIAVVQKARSVMKAQYAKVIDTLLLATWGGKIPNILLPASPSGWQASADWRELTTQLLHDLGVPIRWETPTGEPGRVVASGSNGNGFRGKWQAVDAYLGCPIESFPEDTPAGACSTENGVQNFNVWIGWESEATQAFAAWVEEVARTGASALAGVAAVGGAAKLVEERMGGGTVIVPLWDTYTTPSMTSKKSGGGLLFLGALAVAGGAAYWIWGR